MPIAIPTITQLDPSSVRTTLQKMNQLYKYDKRTEVYRDSSGKLQTRNVFGTEYDLNNLRDLAIVINNIKNVMQSLAEQIRRFEKLYTGTTLQERLEGTYTGRGETKDYGYINTNYETFKNVLIDQILVAFSKNKDLNITEWKEHLVSLVKKSQDIIDIQLVYGVNPATGATFVEDVAVMIDMERVAGTLNDYEIAVTATREMKKYGHTIQSGRLATRLWFERLWQAGRGFYTVTEVKEGETPEDAKKRHRKERDKYNRELKGRTARIGAGKQYGGQPIIDLNKMYWDIMNMRLQLVADKAPYWYLLQYGSVDMKGKEGAYASPPIRPYDFLDNSARIIRDKIIARSERYVISQRQLELFNFDKTRLKELNDLMNELGKLYTSVGEEEIFARATELTALYIQSKVPQLIRELKALPEYHQNEVSNRIMAVAKQIAAGEPTQPRLYLAHLRTRGKFLFGKRGVMLEKYNKTYKVGTAQFYKKLDEDLRKLDYPFYNLRLLAEKDVNKIMKIINNLINYFEKRKLATIRSITKEPLIIYPQKIPTKSRKTTKRVTKSGKTVELELD